MLFFYNEVIPAGQTVLSVSQYFGTDTNIAHMSERCVFIKGAGANVQINMEVACIPTDRSLNPQPLDTDYIVANTYTANSLSAQLLAGVWVRFSVTNNSSSAVSVTCSVA